jgi:uncharacterized protein
MSVVDTSLLPPIPWKDGCGVTRNLAIWPEDAGFDDFAWRVSIADVESSGSFSVFPGVDRTLLLLDGDGMLLEGAMYNGHPGPAQLLTTPFLPYTLRGEDRIHAHLVNGRARDFNVMVRREIARARVEGWHGDETQAHDSAIAVFFCARGKFRVTPCDGESFVVPTAHALTLRNVEAGLRVTPESQQAVLIGAFLESAPSSK